MLSLEEKGKIVKLVNKLKVFQATEESQISSLVMSNIAMNSGSVLGLRGNFYAKSWSAKYL